MLESSQAFSSFKSLFLLQRCFPLLKFCFLWLGWFTEVSALEKGVALVKSIMGDLLQYILGGWQFVNFHC